MPFKIKEQFREKLFIAFGGIREDLFECRCKRACKSDGVLQQLKSSGFIDSITRWI